MMNCRLERNVSAAATVFIAGQSPGGRWLKTRFDEAEEIGNLTVRAAKILDLSRRFEPLDGSLSPWRRQTRISRPVFSPSCCRRSIGRLMPLRTGP